ncbi:MAG TPA: DMT family transporter [Acidimicrobiales bacterium]|nr:DMT family transporter [Acidimicrobiales bacterium]
MRRLLVLAFIWGWSFLFIKVAVEGLTPSTVAWARIALGALVLWVFLRRRGLTLPTDRLMLRHFTVMAVVGTALPFTMLAWGEERISSALTSVLNASTPLFTALFAVAVGQERLRRPQVAGLAVGVVGVAVAAGLGGSDLEGSSVAGSLAAIGAGVCYGVSITYARRHLTDTPPLVAAAGQLLAGTVLLAPVALGTSAASGVHLSPTRVLAVLLLGSVGTGVAFLLHYANIAEMGATKASLVTYLVPVVAVVVGILALDETFEWRLPIGGVLTVAGIVAVTSRRTSLAAAPPAGLEPATEPVSSPPR